MNSRLLPASLLALLVGVAASDALADGKAPEKKADTKSVAAKPMGALFESLPSGKIDLPTHLSAPESIPATEKVDGVYLDVPDYVKANPAAQRYAQVYPSKEDQQAMTQGTPTQSNECFMSAGAQMNQNEEVHWNGSFANQTTIQPVPRSYTYSQYGSQPKDLAYVGALRVERLINQTPSKVTLETRIVLADAQTLGARLVSTTNTDFALIEELPGKVRVYGMKSDDSVTFLVQRDRLADERSPVGPMFAQEGSIGTVNTSEGCHLTFTLPVKHATASTAVVQLEALLEIRPANPDDPPPAPMEKDVDVPAAQAVGTGQKEGRLRPMQIGFSSTWLSEDKSPVLSISHGWTGRERTQPM